MLDLTSSVPLYSTRYALAQGRVGFSKKEKSRLRKVLEEEEEGNDNTHDWENTAVDLQPVGTWVGEYHSRSATCWQTDALLFDGGDQRWVG